MVQVTTENPQNTSQSAADAPQAVPPHSVSPVLGQDHPGFQDARKAARDIAERTGVETHRIAVVLGSGWKGAAEQIGETEHVIPTEEIHGFSAPAVPGHDSSLRSVRRTVTDASGETRDEHVLVFGSRAHYYEHRDVEDVAHTVRTASAAGAQIVVLTNGCGGVNADFQPGDAVLISDHINLTGDTPLSGAEFIDLTDLYSSRLRAVAREVDPSLKEGVYVQFSGPQYETPAEVRMAKILGGDLVGMSTALDAIAARHAGMEILGMSLVTNHAAGIAGEALSHDEVIEIGKQSEQRIGELLAKIIAKL